MLWGSGSGHVPFSRLPAIRRDPICPTLDENRFTADSRTPAASVTHPPPSRYATTCIGFAGVHVTAITRWRGVGARVSPQGRLIEHLFFSAAMRPRTLRRSPEPRRRSRPPNVCVFYTSRGREPEPWPLSSYFSGIPVKNRPATHVGIVYISLGLAPRGVVTDCIALEHTLARCLPRSQTAAASQWRRRGARFAFGESLTHGTTTMGGNP